MEKKISTRLAMKCAISDMKETFTKEEKTCLWLVKRSAKSFPLKKVELLTLSVPNRIIGY